MKILIIGTVWPEPSSSAAGSRMLQLIDLFQAQNWKITFASAAQKNEHSFDLTALGIEEIPIELNNSSFNEFVSDLNPELVMFDRFMTEEQFGWRVRKECPKALLVLDSEDLHFLRNARELASIENREEGGADLRSESAIREIASIYRCDLTLIISSFEMELLTTEFGMNPDLIYYLPFKAEVITEESINNLPGFNDRQHFMTIGNFLHAPNWDSVQFLKQKIWPLIRKELPQADMHVFGAYASEKHRVLHDPKGGFHVIGRTEFPDDEYLSHRVMLAPIRFGAGLKGKLFDAMRYGLPSVTTGIGAEGLSIGLQWAGMIADDPEEFAHSAVRLYQDQLVWNQANRMCSEILNTRFSDPSHANNFVVQINGLTGSLNEHRNRNFIGQMLHHHTMRSTEFMSRWIEEKNQ